MGPLSDMQYVGDRNVGTWRMTDCIPPQPRHVSTSPNSWQILRNIVRSSLRTQQKTGGEFTEYAGGGKRNSCMEIWREGPSTWPLSVPPSTATAIKQRSEHRIWENTNSRIISYRHAPKFHSNYAPKSPALSNSAQVGIGYKYGQIYRVIQTSPYLLGLNVFFFSEMSLFKE
jgi:hypothetical protein